MQDKTTEKQVRVVFGEESCENGKSGQKEEKGVNKKSLK